MNVTIMSNCSKCSTWFQGNNRGTFPLWNISVMDFFLIISIWEKTNQPPILIHLCVFYLISVNVKPKKMC